MLTSNVYYYTLKIISKICGTILCASAAGGLYRIGNDGRYGLVHFSRSVRLEQLPLSVHTDYVFVLFVFCGAAAQRGPWPPHS